MTFESPRNLKANWAIAHLSEPPRSIGSTANPDFSHQDLLSIEKVIYWTIVLTPLWWLLGVQTLLYPAVIAVLFVRHYNLRRILGGKVPTVVWGWVAMAIVMLWTATLGFVDINFAPMKVLATLVTFWKSYFLIVAALLLPFLTTVRLKVVTRAVCWMAVGYLVAIAIQLLILLSGIGFEGYLPPLAKLIPGDKLSLMVNLAVYQPFFGVSLPRTVLYMPDPPVTGIGALLFFFICLGESQTRLRRWALAGCLAALLISFSRLSWLCFPVALCILYGFHLTWIRQSLLWGISITSLLSGLWGLSLMDLGSRSMAFFNSARAESSVDREFVVRKTMEAWLERPWLGWGVIRDSVKWHIYDVVLGSFSTYASVLYLHGLLGFVVFILALLLTIAQFLVPAIQGHVPSQRAFACLIVLCILCQGIPFSWLVVYIWLFFLWLGAVIQDYSPKPKLNLNLPRLKL